MVASTRSSGAQLRGPLEPPSRARGGQGLSGPSGNHPHSNLGPQGPRYRSPGEGRQRASPSSEPGEGYGDGNRRRGLRMLGSYPLTPLHAGDPGPLEGGPDQTPGERARRALEAQPSSRARRAYRRAQSLTDRSSGESEGPPEADGQQGNRRFCQRLESVGGEKDTFPSASQERCLEIQEERRRENAEFQLKEFLRPSTLEEDHRTSPDCCRSLQQHPLDLKVSHAILDSLESINSNFSTFDNNAEQNFQNLVKKIDNSFTAIKNVDDRVFHVLKQMNKPLPIEMTAHHSDMITVIYKDVEMLKENIRDQKEISKEVALMVKSFQDACKINTDFILSTLKQDAIIKREEINK